MRPMRDQGIKGRYTPLPRRTERPGRDRSRSGSHRGLQRCMPWELLGTVLEYWGFWVDRFDPARRAEPAALELAEIVSRSNDAGELRRALVRLACRMSGADRAELFREQEPGFSPCRVAVWPEAARPLSPCVAEATTLSLADRQADRADSSVLETAGAAPIEREDADELRLPIVVAGRPWGELRLAVERRGRRRRRKRWPRGLIRSLNVLGAFVGGAEISMTSILEPLAEDPTRDALTGRPNEAFFRNALPLLLSYAQRRREPLTLLHIAAEKLDAVRDLQGPSIADALLRRLSNAVSATLRASDLVARLDETDAFAAVLAGAPLADASGIVVEALRRAVAEAGIASARPLSVSIGIAGYPEHGHDPKRLPALAREACRSAQARGDNQIAVAPIPAEGSAASLGQNVLSPVPSIPLVRNGPSHSQEVTQASAVPPKANPARSLFSL